VQRSTGDYQRAADSFTQAMVLFHDLGDRVYEGAALVRLGVMYRLTGDYPAAAASLIQALTLCREVGDRQGQAQALNHLGALQTATLGPAAGLAQPGALWSPR
jgi:tetratricopeptide (TPR) repeat protein